MIRLKNYLRLYFLCAAALMLLHSCLGNDDEETSSTCTIQSFGIGNISTTFTETSSKGTDSTYVKMIGGSDIRFSIDQIHGRIFNVDTLPSWTDVSSIKASVICAGNLFIERIIDGRGIFVPFASASDTLNLTSPRTLMVVSTDLTTTKKYVLNLIKRSAVEDSIKWSAPETIENKGKLKSIFFNGKMQIFDEQYKEIDYSSIQAFGTRLIGLDSLGNICSSDDASNWVKTSATAQKLVAADDYYLYALSNDTIFATRDFSSWTPCCEDYTQYLPDSSISSLAFTSRSNPYIQDVVMIGTSKNDKSHSVVWYKVSSAKSASNQDWTFVSQETSSSFALPRFKNISNIIYYNSYIYVIGDGKFYRSKDCGITWKQVENSIKLPQSFNKDLPTSMTIVGNTLWLIQGGDATHQGQMWQGKLNTYMN